MERLAPIGTRDPREILRRMGVVEPGIQKIEQYYHDYVNMSGDTGLKLRSLFRNETIRKMITTLSTDRHFREAMYSLSPLLRHYSVDLHINNFMQRSNGQLVILDPIEN